MPTPYLVVLLQIKQAANFFCLEFNHLKIIFVIIVVLVWLSQVRLLQTLNVFPVVKVINIIFLYLLDGDIGTGDNVVNYGKDGKDGNMTRITWWQGISNSPTPSLWTGCCREYFWSGSPAPPRSDHHDHVDKDTNTVYTNAFADDPCTDENDVACWYLTSMSATFSRE